MFNRISWFLISLFFFLLSFDVFTSGGGFVIYGYYADYSNLKILAGIIFSSACLITFFYAVFGKFKKPESEILICSNCEETYKKEIAESQHCPKCHSGLENLKGFYERHPELRLKKK